MQRGPPGGVMTPSTSWLPEGTPVIAAADGTIEKLFFSTARGGITIYERSPDQKWMYYYAHLSAYAPGLAEGQQVKRGQVIARVGHTGDASAAGPHLHFAINTMAPGERWWQGTPINPYPLLAGKKAAARSRARLFPNTFSERRHEDQRRGHPSRQHHRI